MASMKCSQCASTSLIRGTLQSTGTVYFRPSAAKFFTFRTAEISVGAHMCSACGTLVMSGDAEKLRQLLTTPSSDEARPQTAAG